MTTPMTTDAMAVDPERHWLDHVYQRGARQLTARAVVMGMLIGMVMCLSNLYVVLKTGWSMGVTITACILAFGAFSVLRAARLTRAEFTALENNAMGSVASAAGYMTGGGNMHAIPALLILTGLRPDPWWLVAWFSTIAALGVFVAIPIKRQLINVEQLQFPTGTATAETIRALHQHGGEGRAQARGLFAAFAFGAFLKLLNGLKVLPAVAGLPFMLRGVPAIQWTLGIELSVLLVGGGMLMSFRVGWSLLLGALVNYAVLAPLMVGAGVIQEVSYKSIFAWSLWPGAAILVSSGLLSFAFEWRTVLRSFKELGLIFRRKQAGAEQDELSSVECPAWWFPAGFALLGPVVAYLCWRMFQIPWWAALAALPLSVVMGFIASRVTGETDVTPTKALGPVTQMLYGAAVPGNMVANVMSANVTGGVGLHAADLLTDLKSGFLLGANPRQQFVAQMFGVVAGAAVVVPVFNLLVPTADVIGSAEFPAPAAQVWAGVSRVMVNGLSGMHPAARTGALFGLAVGVALALGDRFLPRSAKRFWPSAAGVGIAMILPFSNSFAFFLGTAIAEAVRRRGAEKAKNLVLPVGAGFIAGESLLGVAIAIAVALGFIAR
jgi:OPT family oligopeptide transporter